MWNETIEEYSQAKAYREALQKGGIVLGLDSMRQLLERMGNPQDTMRFVHIAGTNGKGSVLAFVSTVLKCAGYCVGRYSSPAVFSVLEQWQIGSRPISRADYTQGMEAVRLAAEQMEADGLAYPTPFEAESALAFWYFRKQHCDIVVLETGMGGLLDATNVIPAVEVAVITPISMDHMGMLGNTLAEIAVQKAGIIKPGCQVVSALQEPEAMQVIRDTCERLQAALYIVEEKAAKGVRYGLRKQRFSYGGYLGLEISMAGTWQIANAMLALQVLECLGRAGYPVREKQLRKGLLETKWPGRFTVLAERPLFIIDGAHNEDAARKLQEAVTFYFTNKRIITIMGILKDKEYEKIAARMAPLGEQIITVTTPGNKRAFPAYELAGVVQPYNPNVTAVDSLQEAVELSYLLAGKDSVILAFGSLSYLGEIAELVANRHKIRRDTHGKSKED